MNLPVLALLLANFTLIIVTPKIFFRRDGRFNLRWWLTAAPFGLCPLVISVAAVTGQQPVIRPSSWVTALQVGAVLLAVGSISLLFFTIGTHRVPISLWHQDNDAPRQIVTHGPYRWIRHPFYVSYLLAVAAALVFHPHWSTLALLVYTGGALTFTARREENRLSRSEFGDQYQRYLARTGRFIPRRTASRPVPVETITAEPTS